MLIIYNKILRKKILSTALPAMVEMSLYMLIGIVDVAIVGRLGAASLAAVSLGAEIFFTIILIWEALAMGSAILAAQAKGAQEPEKINAVSVQTCLIALTLGLLVSLLGLTFVGDIVSIFRVEESVSQPAIAYLRIVFYVSPMAILYCMLNALFRGVGRTDIPMKVALLVNLINSLGDYVLVYGKFGFPQLGVSGAAWATSLAHVVGFIITFYLLFNGSANDGMRLHFTYPTLKTFKDILRLGIPSMGEQIFMGLSGLASTFLIVLLGTVSYASHQISLTVESLSYMPGFGIAIAATSLVGQSVGAQNKANAIEFAKGTLEFAVMLMGAIGVSFAVFPYFIAGLFTNDSNIIAVSGLLIRIASLEQITIALGMVLGGILKGTGDTRNPMLINLVFVIFFRLPLMYILICIRHAPIHWIWCLFVIDWLLRAGSYWIVYRKNQWFKTAGTGSLSH